MSNAKHRRLAVQAGLTSTKQESETSVQKPSASEKKTSSPKPVASTGLLGDLQGSIGIEDAKALAGLMGQFVLLDPLLRRENTPERVNSCFAIVKAIRSGKLIELQLAMQMSSAHSVAMTFLARALDGSLSVELRQYYGNEGNKLMRTYSNLVDCFDRHRGGTTQQMVVEGNVNIASGSQAIVGPVSHSAPQKDSGNDDEK